MNKLFSEFPKVSKEKWEEVLKKELKGADFNSLLRNDEIEEINFPTYTHENDLKIQNEIPGKSTFIRGTYRNSNDWVISKKITVFNEVEANKEALTQLMNGNTGLVFDLKKEQINFNILFQDIAFQFIETQIIIRDLQQIEELNNYFNQKEFESIFYRLDFINDLNFEEINALSNSLKGKNIPFCFVNAFEIEQTGATIIQQLTFALASGHEYLVKLIENGYSIEEAEKSIHFSFGFGNKYFYEIGKVRAFRKLWAKIVQSYEPNARINCHISGEIGFSNKSLQDPYTNLLRQTTEVMSAVSGGVNTLIVHPFNQYSNEGETLLASRMATNISLILKDESYFDKVIDPIGGSYAIENLTLQIAEKTWCYFQKMDELGGILNENATLIFRNDVANKVKAKENLLQSGKKILIGINKFPNPTNETASWKSKYEYFGMDQFIYERDIKMN